METLTQPSRQNWRAWPDSYKLAMLERLRAKPTPVPPGTLLIEDGRTLRLHAAQQIAWDSKARTVIMSAGTQSGKTVFEPVWLYREIQKHGRGDYIAATSSYRIFRNKFLPSFLRFFERVGRAKLWIGDGLIEIADPNGKFMAKRSTDEMWARILLGSAQSPGTLESATAKAAVLDEAGQDDFTLRAYQAIRRRLHIHEGRMLIGTTLYNSGWFAQKLIKPTYTSGTHTVTYSRGGEIEVSRDKATSTDLVQFDSVVNPVFSMAEYTQAEATMATDEFNMFYRGRIGRPATMIYNCFDDEVHKVRAFRPPEHWPRVVGIDPVGVYTSAVFLAWDPQRAVMHLYDEYSEPFGLTTPEHARRIGVMLSRSPVAAIICGQPGERQARADFQGGGLPVREPPFADVWVGINRVYAMLKTFRLFVHDNCEHTLDEIGRYQRLKDSSGEATNKIEHKDTFHMCDSLRYAVAWATEPSQGPGRLVYQPAIITNKY